VVVGEAGANAGALSAMGERAVLVAVRRGGFLVVPLNDYRLYAGHVSGAAAVDLSDLSVADDVVARYV